MCVGLAALAATSCGHTIVDTPTKFRDDGWVLTIRKVTDGPNAYREMNTAYTPVNGQRLIWVHVTLRNLKTVPRKFNFDRCDLDAGDKVYVPTLIDADDIGGNLVAREPELGVNEYIDRRLIFAYPRDRSPTRLSCTPMVMPLPQF